MRGYHNARAVERFTRADDETIDYRFTIEDPTVFTRPWTALLPLGKLHDYVIYEYACHEGNYGLYNILAGAREQEAAVDRAASAVRP